MVLIQPCTEFVPLLAELIKCCFSYMSLSKACYSSRLSVYLSLNVIVF